MCKQFGIGVLPWSPLAAGFLSGKYKPGQKPPEGSRATDEKGGSRFIQLYHRDWDHHGSVKDHSAGSAKEVDQGVAALITDLKQRDMLKDTLVVFGTEFGRTPGLETRDVYKMPTWLSLGFIGLSITVAVVASLRATRGPQTSETAVR